MLGSRHWRNYIARSIRELLLELHCTEEERRSIREPLLILHCVRDAGMLRGLASESIGVAAAGFLSLFLFSVRIC